MMSSWSKYFFLSTVSLLLTGATLCAYAQDIDQAMGSLTEDIQNAQLELEQTQQLITEQRRNVSERLQLIEDEVRDLSEAASAAQRVADERTLSLNTLTSRLEEWQEQSRYQHYLLDSFRTQVELPHEAGDFSTGSLAQKLRWLDQYLEDTESRLQPRWREQELIMPGGQIQSAALLSMGPVSWYLDEGERSGGLVDSTSTPLPEVLLPLGQSAVSELVQLKTSGSGLVDFDPTLSRAFKLEQQNETLLEHITRGGLWVIPILAFAGIALLVALVKALQFWRLPALTVKPHQGAAGIGSTESREEPEKLLTLQPAQLKGMERKLLEIALSCPAGQTRDDRLLTQLNADRRRLERWLGAMALIAAVSPLLGLLGTVSGMIETFQLMTLFGAGDPQAVSSGISKALVTTELGLVVAIPTLLLHAVLSRRVKTYCAGLESSAIEFSRLPGGG